MNEAKDMATSFRYAMDIEAEMEKQRQQTETEPASPPVASGSHAPPESSKVAAGGTGRSPRAHKSAIKQSTEERSKSPNGKAKEGAPAQDSKEGASKGKRKVTFDVQPEVAVIKDDGEFSSGQPTPTAEDQGLSSSFCHKAKD